jgi:hypothetical protein
MASAEFLSSKSDLATTVPQPEAYKRTGMYPERYRVTFNEEASEYRMVLEDLVQREDS